MVRFWLLFFSLFLNFSSFCWAQLNSRFLLQNESFLSPQFEATEKSTYQFVGFNLRNGLDSEKLILDSEAVIAVGAPLLNYIKFKEFALVIPNSPTQTLILGRKKMLWSEMDEAWSLGTIEPVFKWNPLNRESHGLSGLFWSSQQPWLQFTAFISPVFLPDQGPSFEINKQGHFTKSNPWFQMPPKTFQPFPGSDSSSDIYYKVRKPPESDVVSQTSIGGSLEGNISDTSLWRTSYFFKPMNQLALGYDGIYNTGTNTGEVDIMPQVGFHRVVSADLVYGLGYSKVGVSYMNDKPEPIKFDEEWTAPVLSEAQMYATFIQFNFQNHMTRLDYLKIEGGKVKEVGELSSPTRAAITSRYPFKEALKAQYEFDLSFNRREKVKMHLSWTHSEMNQFDLVQLKGHYQLTRLMQVYADMQFVKAEALTIENSNEISPQENNDRFMVGMAYEL